MSSLAFIRFWLAALPLRTLVVVAMISATPGCFGAAPSSPALSLGKASQTNAQELQAQLHATQLAIERNRNEAAAVEENAKAIVSRLQGLEQSTTPQSAHEIEAKQSSNRGILFVAGLVAAAGMLSLLFTAYLQCRTMNRLVEAAAVLPPAHLPPSGPPEPALATASTLEQSIQRLLGALEQVEKTICQFGQTPNPPSPKGGSLAPPPPPALSPPARDRENSRHSGPALPPPAGAKENCRQPESALSPAEGQTAGVRGAATAPAASAPDAARIATLLEKGQSLLNLDQAEEALAYFDHVLALDPNRPEALVKKGAALERLRKLDEAIACYDKAIAADGSLTMAYLCKGGLLNRLERFDEALECYQQALRTQKNGRG